MTIPNINIVKVVDTLQFLSRFSQELLKNPESDEAKEQVKGLINQANMIINDFYQIPNKSNT